MQAKSKVNIVSSATDEFSEKIKSEGREYFVQTEDLGTRTCKAVSRIYQKGEVVFSRSSDYRHVLTLKDSGQKRQSILENLHRNTITLFLEQQRAAKREDWDYFEEIRSLLREGQGKSALQILRNALEQYPDDPFLLSYYGYLLASEEKSPREGVRICREALVKLERAMPLGRDFYYPVLYLNLGRAYLKCRKKKEAVEAFTKGVHYDTENRDLNSELDRLGKRQKPPLPFISRSNPLNKYLGKILRAPQRKSIPAGV